MKTSKKQISQDTEDKLMSLQEDSPANLFLTQVSGGGQTDDRYLWPEMLRVIDEIRPTWVVGENVAGITTMVESDAVTDLGCYSSLFEEDNRVHRYRDEQTFTIERICKDLESKGYSVQPLLIPAAAVGAPHRRERIFIIAHTEDPVRDGRECRQKKEQKCERNIWDISPGNSKRIHREERANASNGTDPRIEDMQREREDSFYAFGIIADSDVNGYSSSEEDRNIESNRCENNGEQELRRIKTKWDNGLFTFPQFSPDSDSRRYSRSKTEKRKGINVMWDNRESIQRYQAQERWAEFPSVSPVHRGNDGLPFDVDNLTIPFNKWRNESIKAYGNAIVPQVMYEIFRAIEEIESI